MNKVKLQLLDKEKEAKEYRSLLFLISEIHEVLHFKLLWEGSSNSIDREKIIDIINKYSKIFSVKICLKTICLSFSRYHRWKRSILKCRYKNRTTCSKFNSNQLTADEILIIKKHITSKKFAHFAHCIYMFNEKNYYFVRFQLG